MQPRAQLTLSHSSNPSQHVKPCFDMSSKICLVSDPRPQNPYGKLYSVEFLGNVVGGKRTVYNNQPIEALMKATAESINRYGTNHMQTKSA